MQLAAGDTLGVYRIAGLIGAGGMGEVYRARDTRLDRDVALKLLPEEFAKSAERLARFQREARTLASLNHPHIAQIYGLEEQPTRVALAMEFVDGEDLAERLERGPLPLDDILAIVRQVSDALESAHAQGIIHRDLKPANIKVRPDGTVKVLDFGLAKAVDQSSGVGLGSSGETSMSPTMTSPAMTAAGVILGTAAYMSPEQAKGRTADRRTDIWAFGAVLFEMLTGQRAFAGETVADTLAAILTREPEWTSVPADTPPAIKRLVRRCLERDPRRRLQAIGEARLQIEALSDGSIAEEPDSDHESRESRWRVVAPWMIAATAIALALIAWMTRPSAPAAPRLRLSVDLGGGVPLANPSFGANVVLSPDSSQIAFVAQNTAGVRQLFVRRLGELVARSLGETEDADSPFFSPDGRWIGFFAVGKLKKVSITGGTAVTICDAPAGRGGAWADDGTIVFSPDGRDGVVLVKVSASGGTPQPLTTLQAGELNHRWPQLLPGDKAVLFTAATTRTYDDADLVIQTLPAGPRKVVHRGGSYGRYLTGGYLAFVHAGALLAAPFDFERLETTGAPMPIVQGMVTSLSGGAQFDVSPAGTLVYAPGTSRTSELPMDWMDRTGRTAVMRQTTAPWLTPRFSPDGARVALDVADAVWIYDVARETFTRLTSDPGMQSNPVWTPDGRRVVFSTSTETHPAANLYWKLADGTRETQQLTNRSATNYAASWHPSGRFLAFEERDVQSHLMILPITGDEASELKPGTPTPFGHPSWSEREPMFSPDGRWIAYGSNQSGRYEVVVTAFKNPAASWQVSTSGGEHATWSRTKPELFYSLDGQIWVAPYRVDGDSFQAETPRRLAETRFVQRAGNRMFDLHPDGERFVLAADATTAGAGEHRTTYVFDFNIFDELRRAWPGK